MLVIIVQINVQVEAGSTCAIWGVGCVGLATIMACKELGASRIFAIDINADKEKFAKEFGATDFLNPKDFHKPLQEVRYFFNNFFLCFKLLKLT